MQIKMLNSFLLCEELEQPTQSEFGFMVTDLRKVKTVKVIQSSEEDIEVGSLVKILSSAGLTDGEDLIIRRSDIIYKL